MRGEGAVIGAGVGLDTVGEVGKAGGTVAEGGAPGEDGVGACG
jgi:hypothetical protein